MVKSCLLAMNAAQQSFERSANSVAFIRENGMLDALCARLVNSSVGCNHLNLM